MCMCVWVYILSLGLRLKLQTVRLVSGIEFTKPCLAEELQRKLVWEEDNEGESILWKPNKTKPKEKLRGIVQNLYAPGIHIDLLK